jgi:acetyl-CoA carboxylase carboxyl transferase subunit beta
LKPVDVLRFEDGGEPYEGKIRKARAKSGAAEACVAGHATMGGRPVVLAVLDFRFMGGSMGVVVGEKIALAAEAALEARCPLIVVSSSGGARMQEGALSLMQMAKTSAALTRLGDARLAHISVLSDPCYGGVTASYATVADIVIAEPGALIGFAGPRVIEQTTRQKLPQGFQTAEFLLEHGMIDLVVPRHSLASTLSTLIDLYGAARQPRRARRARADASEPAPEPVGASTGAANGD